MNRLPARVDAEPETVGRDLGKLVLTIVELLRQLMERQAIRRVEAGDLPEETVERLGLGLMRLEEAMDELREYFGLRPEDLNIDLGPLGNLFVGGLLVLQQHIELILPVGLVDQVVAGVVE